MHECRQAWNIGAPCSDALSPERAPWGGRKHLEVNRSFSGAAGAALGPGSSQSLCELSKDALALASVRSLSSEGFRRQGVSHITSVVAVWCFWEPAFARSRGSVRYPICGTRLCVALLATAGADDALRAGKPGGWIYVRRI